MPFQGPGGDSGSLYPSKTSIQSASKANSSAGGEVGSPGHGKNINTRGFARSTSLPSPIEQKNIQNPRARHPKLMVNPRNPSNNSNNTDNNSKGGASNNDSKSSGPPRTSSLPADYKRAVPPRASTVSKSSKTPTRQRSSASANNSSANASGNFRASSPRGNLSRRQQFLSGHNNLGKAENSRAGSSRSSRPTSPRDEKGVSAAGRQQLQHFERHVKQLDDGARSDGVGMLLDGRDEEAKARRLCRFNTELNRQPGLTQTDLSPLTSNRSSQPQRSKALQDAAESMDYEDFDALPDRDCAMAEAILGSCQEMCPESEREERERTGDIDKFERLDGNGNQPDCYLLVKKYNRGAEREACLIRPLPVLRKTMEHLTNLMNCAYDEDFLSLYNFLWDRMRAIRMDMRMQHIFNHDTIRMHEQMIRFHIVAMHELCESAKGEGFSEEFDAHLNIEQMNKTSVELFQMYDDHRKKGILAPSEAEFRGYYALLKLDKHPGHMVEPAELSLDLSKMTPEIRNTSEVLFARQVARASRSTNFIQFFRHARKATYLQSCLMHAHFTKLRTQALASLYSALQKNQGVPVSQLVKWLAMEGEDMEALLTYHGFSLKQYQEAYMVKEGPFLNRDNDFPTKRSQLVYNKRSSRVFDDVISSRHVPIIDATFHTLKATDGATDRCINMHKATNTPDVTATLPSEEEMPDYEDELHGATYRCINMHKATNTLDVTATLPSEEEMPDYEYQLQPPHCEVKEWKINQQLGGSVDKQMHSLKEACEVPSLTGAPLDKRMPSVKGSCEVPILSVAPLDKRMLPVKGSCEVPILSVAPLDKDMPSVKEACQVPILTVAPLDKDMPSVQEACQVPIPTVTPPATEMLSVGKACEAPMATVKPTFGVQNITYLFKAEMTDVISKNDFQQKEQPSHKRKSYFSPGTARQHRRRIGEVEEDLKAAENNDFIPKTFSGYDKKENDVARDTSQYIIAECKQREEEERLALYWKEIQLIRLKLLLRRWKRQAAKKRKERHLNHLESGYALSSLCLGRPVQPNKLVSPGEELISGIPRQPVPAKALTWEQIFRERQSRHERMWSKLQLPELIAPILREKNPQAKCLCWKLIICSRTRDNDGHDKQRHTHRTNTASQWLLAKLIGNGRTNDEVLLSSPDMVIMKKQLNIACEHSGSHDLFFLSIVKDLSFNIETVEREDACLGASGIIFLLLEDVQWDIERARLRSLVNTVPSGSKLPLLIICSKNCEESRPQNQQVIGSMQAKIERELEVLCLDRTKIGSLSIISITEIEGGVARGGFFSDECLRDGLLWLAYEAPVQPVVYPSDLRGLVQEYLNNYFVVLNKKPAEVRPDHCIHAFNESLDRTAHDISKTAQNSHPHWPPPEIRLLDKTTENRILVNSFLPNPGWNIASNIYSILQVLQVCRLPQFPALNSNYIFCGTQEQGVSSSGLNPGRTEWDEIQKLKSCFKKLLDDYLRQIGFIRENDMMSLKEADIMLQKGAVFEHSGLRYAIIPKWATIFQRIFSWRLMLLASEPPLVVYVSQPHSTASSGFEQKQQLASGHQVFLGSSYAHQGPSLDEMVRLSIPCNPTVTPNNPMVGDQFMEKLKELNLESTAEAGDIYLLEKENYSRHVHDVVQEEITSNERYPDVELSQTSLEFPPTEEELHLDDVVKKYCAKVDEQMRWTQMEAERAKGSMHPALIEEARSPIAQNEFLTQVADKSCPELSNDSQYLPSWADDNGMETLSRLVEQCDNVQRTIDNKLWIYSSGNNDSSLNK